MAENLYDFTWPWKFYHLRLVGFHWPTFLSYFTDMWHLLASWQPAWQLNRSLPRIGRARNRDLSCCCLQCWDQAARLFIDLKKNDPLFVGLRLKRFIICANKNGLNSKIIYTKGIRDLHTVDFPIFSPKITRDWKYYSHRVDGSMIARGNFFNEFILP